jgi:hypothetical protein
LLKKCQHTYHSRNCRGMKCTYWSGPTRYRTSCSFSETIKRVRTSFTVFLKTCIRAVKPIEARVNVRQRCENRNWRSKWDVNPASAWNCKKNRSREVLSVLYVIHPRPTSVLKYYCTVLLTQLITHSVAS